MNPLATGACIVIAALLALCGWEEVQRAHLKTALATEKTARAEEKTASERAARVQTENFAAQSSAWRKTQQENANENRAVQDALLAQLAAERSSRSRLQQRADALAAAAGQATRDPGAQPAGQTAQEAADLLAELLGGIDARAGEIAEFADRASAAGTLCERDYDALTMKGTP